MLTTSTKKRMRQVISIMVMVAMMLGFGGLSAAKSFAVYGPEEITNPIKGGTVTDYSGLGMQYAMSKTVDLSDTDVDVTITPAEREAIMESVRDEAKKYIDEHFDNFGFQEPEVSDPAFKAKLIEWKTQELYNNKIGDLLVEKLGSQLNAKFSFSVVPLAEDGSEDAAFGVDGTTIKRGTFKEGVTEMPFSQIDFAAEGQIYDEILMENMAKIIAGKQDNGENNRDGRDSLTRAMIFDMGQLISSDDSQYSYGCNMERSLEKGWEGWHFLLEVGDSLATYDVFMPYWSYIRTFNLHLNPAVVYIADYARADLITGTEFDDSGKLVSITKPIMPASEKNELRVDYLKPVYDRLGDYFDASADGTYRFKLVESQIDPVELPNGAKFKDNNEEKIFDVTVNGENIKLSLYEDAAGYDKYQEAVDKTNKAYEAMMNGTGSKEDYTASIQNLGAAFLQALPAFTNSVTKEEEPTTEPTTKPDGDGTPDGTPDKEVSQKTPTDTPTNPPADTPTVAPETPDVVDTPANLDGGKNTDSGDSDKGSKGSKTGDSTNMIIPGLLALLALVTGGSVAIRRRRQDH